MIFVKKKKIKIETPQDKLKYEIAKELGLMEKIKEVGWGGLTAKETGRIGGIMTVRNRNSAKVNNKEIK
ncbi:small, acid-soluble spore protein, alpha/beta type [Proteiniborus sp. MB09-C3]|nr:small, acid-soluble spore protein, alpha/beta type [Proteiniborus sp. MB09-C3]WIV11418.1 small, acid-soluble spore protein, alpha/beta type [Proteiniborus sp. MB09-C3]